MNPWLMSQAMAPEWTGGHGGGKGKGGGKSFKGKFAKGKGKGKDKGKIAVVATATAALCPPLCGVSATTPPGKGGSASVDNPPAASTSPEGAAAPTPELATATLSLRAVKKRGFRVQVPPMRSVKRVAEYVASNTLHLLPKSKKGEGLCWIAVGLEPATFRSPQILEVLQKEEGNLVVDAQPCVAAEQAAKPEIVAPAKPCVEADQAAKPEIEKADLTETPTKKRKAKLPRLADFLPQVPGPLGPAQVGESVADAAAKVDQKDI